MRFISLKYDEVWRNRGMSFFPPPLNTGCCRTVCFQVQALLLSLWSKRTWTALFHRLPAWDVVSDRSQTIAEKRKTFYKSETDSHICRVVFGEIFLYPKQTLNCWASSWAPLITIKRKSFVWAREKVTLSNFSSGYFDFFIPSHPCSFCEGLKFNVSKYHDILMTYQCTCDSFFQWLASFWLQTTFGHYLSFRFDEELASRMVSNYVMFWLKPAVNPESLFRRVVSPGLVRDAKIFHRLPLFPELPGAGGIFSWIRSKVKTLGSSN